ncbi:uncharacterized protein A1O9_10215 [Exophiala aquamarina CBS 119918]|uniref:DUF7703 domain-containing protein n=1 Tax=Exophiala aquamarina CBS 119918 TaxID=1182545 RepID=A0A072P129_9EURO|nr:uncharacterized protein A1O9_10215 [Exophiala aquamarina CBS 119918]KEF53814.1 hypothetical protein A1O9_10215 [Exophiala aquamarina CBS 119918]
MGRDFYTGTFDYTTILVVVTTALSFYNSIELTILIFTTFTSYRGLYFWSLLISTSGLIPYCIGLVLHYFRLGNNLAGLIINNYGWCAFVTGQSVVLYSRLGIVLGRGNDRILKSVKWMIIIDAILFHVTTTVLEFVGNFAQPASSRPSYQRGYVYIEKIQMTGFCVQEFIISGLYVWKTLDILKTQDSVPRSGSTSSDQSPKKHVHRVMLQLVIINVVIIALDILLLVVEFYDLHIAEISIKPFVYSVKLKLEFAVLSKLVETSSSVNQRTRRSLSLTADRSDPHMATFDGHPPLPTLQNSTGTDLDFAIDPTRKSANLHLRTTLSATSTSASSRPQWMEDLEKSDISTHVEIVGNDSNAGRSDTPKGPFSQQMQQHEMVEPDQYDPPNHRKLRKGSDLLYADALLALSKRNEGA